MGYSISRFYGITRDDRVLGFLPCYHINAPMVTGIACITAGAHIHFAELFGFTNAKFIWRTVERFRISVISLTPSIMATIVRLFPEGANANISTVRFGLVGTARLESELWKTFESRFGFPCYQGYGLTETTTWATMTPPDDRKRYETAGVPVDCEIRIDRLSTGDTMPDAVGSGTDAQPPAREIGEILIRGSLIMQGYNNRRKLTRQVIDGDGWFRTGDLGYLADNQLVISDGSRISSREMAS